MQSQNLLVTEDWQIKVCDFGLSRTSSLNNQNSLSKLRGTYAYAAPEVYFGDKYSSKSDIYSMGVVMWELLSRTVRGIYSHPFSDQRSLISFEFQIVIEVAKVLLLIQFYFFCFCLLNIFFF
jgi:serine/threonine protein kinase